MWWCGGSGVGGVCCVVVVVGVGGDDDVGIVVSVSRVLGGDFVGFGGITQSLDACELVTCQRFGGATFTSGVDRYTVEGEWDDWKVSVGKC